MVMLRFDVHEHSALETIPLLTEGLSNHLLLFRRLPPKEPEQHPWLMLHCINLSLLLAPGICHYFKTFQTNFDFIS